jgi:hypothetical protein
VSTKGGQGRRLYVEPKQPVPPERGARCTRARGPLGSMGRARPGRCTGPA